MMGNRARGASSAVVYRLSWAVVSIRQLTGQGRVEVSPLDAACADDFGRIVQVDIIVRTGSLNATGRMHGSAG